MGLPGHLRLISPVRPGENLLLPHGHVGGEFVSAALPVEPHEDSGEVHQPALLAEDDVEEVPVLALPVSPPQGQLCLLVLTVPVSLGIPRYINPEGNFLSEFPLDSTLHWAGVLLGRLAPNNWFPLTALRLNKTVRLKMITILLSVISII